MMMMLPLSDTECEGGGGAGHSNYPFMTSETRNNWFVMHMTHMTHVTGHNNNPEHMDQI